tara:strand:+ start:4205 stop:4684 length:480 start_codon:yes stop_codon:yes gene_type:complete
MKYELIDNFLEPDELKSVQDVFLGMKIAWNCIDGIVMPGDGGYQFVHVLYSDYQPTSPFFNSLTPIFNKIDPIAIVRVKANLNMKTPQPVSSSFHKDVDDCITSIFYLNTNNGKTVFESGLEVDSVENRMIIFDSNEKHHGITTTDTARRCLINFNYFI